MGFTATVLLTVEGLRLVSGQVSLLLRRTIDPDRRLSDYGPDSP